MHIYNRYICICIYIYIYIYIHEIIQVTIKASDFTLQNK